MKINEMFKYFVLITSLGYCFLSCKNVENIDAEKLAITAKMQEKVRKVSVELKAYCDSETYRKARSKADSILAGRKLIRIKRF